jgi:hypothetical protein
MSDHTAESYYLAGKDAAAKEREDRLTAAKKKVRVDSCRDEMPPLTLLVDYPTAQDIPRASV